MALQPLLVAPVVLMPNLANHLLEVKSVKIADDVNDGDGVVLITNAAYLLEVVDEIYAISVLDYVIEDDVLELDDVLNDDDSED